MSDLPPLDQTQAHVVVGPNDQRGPYTLELLISEVLAGRLSEATPVWWPGLSDWTTMGSHPGVAAELARRRGASAAQAPAWADPGAAQAPPQGEPGYAQQAPTQQLAGSDQGAAAPAADPFTAPAPEVQQGAAQPDAGVIDVSAGETSEIDPVHAEAFALLRSRSAARAEIQASVDGVNAQLVAASIEGAEQQGFSLSEQIDTDRTQELRFDGANGDLLVVSLGRASATLPADLRSDHVPVTVSYRSSVSGSRAEAGTGEHGDVVVTADEWTGQSTSSVSLFLGLEHYLDDQLGVDSAAVARDVASTVAVVRSKLS